MFNYIAKFDGPDEQSRPISENFVSVLIKSFFPGDDVELKMQDIKFGHPLKLQTVTISAWPADGEEN